MLRIPDDRKLRIVAKAYSKSITETNINKCVPGMEIAETIFNEFGAILIHIGTILDLSMIKMLKRLGFEKIKVYEANENNASEDLIQTFKLKYERTLVTLIEVFQDLDSGKPLDSKKVSSIADSITDKNIQEGEILKNIHLFQQFDKYIYTHCLNVSIISMLISRWLKYKENDIRNVVMAGLLHDIGKVKINKNILNKPGLLTPHEFETVKKHVLYSVELSKNMPEINKEIQSAILMHHEREDGRGYMLGLKGDKIHEFAKIIAVADAFDAMSSDRIYKKSISPFEIFGQMENEETGCFNKRIVASFLQFAPAHYIGEKFFISSNEIGEVVFINSNSISRPLIKIGSRYIDLSKDSELKLGHMV